MVSKKIQQIPRYDKPGEVNLDTAGIASITSQNLFATLKSERPATLVVYYRRYTPVFDTILVVLVGNSRTLPRLWSNNALNGAPTFGTAKRGFATHTGHRFHRELHQATNRRCCDLYSAGMVTGHLM